jgi:hypothetical protein
MADKIVMGYWDCPSCDSKGIPGTTYDCPNCGRQRGSETKFYMRSGKIEYVPGHKVIGADWYCEYCGALNTAGRTDCENCGSPKEDSKDDYFSLKKPKPAPAVTRTPETRKVNIPKKSNLSLKARIRRTPLWIKIVITLILAIVISNVVSAYINRPRNYTFDVNEVAWENIIQIEECKTFREDDWYLPNGAVLAYTKEEIRSYDSVLDHYESVTKTRQVQDGGHYETSYTDNGDGTFTEHSTYVTDYTTEYYTVDEPVYVQVPVYDTKYYYDIDRWVETRTVTAIGTDKEPYWPEPVLGANERLGSRKTKFTMKGILHYSSFGFDKEKEVTYEIREEWWKNIEAGQTLDVTLVGNKISAIN